MQGNGMPTARVVKLAIELAETGQFADTSSVERELLAVGLPEGEIKALERPALRSVIDEACAIRREHRDPSWHRHESY
jgi:hypothetical protein